LVSASSSPLSPVRAVAPHVSLLLFSARLTPHLTLPLTDLQGQRQIALVLMSHPPLSERYHTVLSPPPHRRLTSLVSRAIIPLARHTPPTAIVPLPSTPQQGSHRRAMATRATALTSAPMTVARCARARIAHVHTGPPAHATPRHCGLGLEPRPSAMFCFFLFFSI
jgi:hypothetical protein